jgi:hypothetical protein
MPSFSAYAALTYSPMSPDPGILGRLSVGSSGGSRKPAQEDSNKHTIIVKIAAACLMCLQFVAEISFASGH